MVTGGCDCGQVRFSVAGVRPARSACHCSQCRRTSGHFWVATHVDDIANVTFHEESGLTWYVSSDWARRGFCKTCGSSLFYRMNGEAGMGIAAGCLDDGAGLAIEKHIFVKDKGAYYEITDGAEQIETF